MSALRDLQLGLAAAILRRQDPATLDLDLRPSGGRLARRLAVYRVNARENFAAALEAAYPVLRAQLGADDFRSLAWSYQSEYPSPSGNLYEAGRRLPEFLAKTRPGTGDEYLRDLARLEWAVQEAMVAADSESRFDPRALAGIPASEHESLRFGLHPSVRIVRTGSAVFGLWRNVHAMEPANRQPSARAKPGPENILVRRAGAGIELHLLDDVEHRCLDCLLGGGSLGEMTDAAIESADAPDIGAVLVRWAALGVITELRVARGAQP